MNKSYISFRFIGTMNTHRIHNMRYNTMKKLTNKTKYDIVNGEVIIYAKRIGSDKFEPAFTCHMVCIDLIKQANSFKVEGVYLIPIN